MSSITTSLPAQVLKELRQIAEQSATMGGQLARAHAESKTLEVRLKSDQSEVSEADEAAQAAISDLLRSERPTDAIIGEEDMRAIDAKLPQPSNDIPCWVIDPIDGTRNYIRGIGDYSCSVGVMYGGYPVVGAVYHASRDLLYSGAIGEPVRVNGVNLPKAGEPKYPIRLEDKLIVAIPSSAMPSPDSMTHRFLNNFVCRNVGSTALHFSMVATAQYDAAFSPTGKLWDIAASAAMILASGGKFTTPEGADLFPIDIAAYKNESLPSLAGTPEGHARVSAI